MRIVVVAVNEDGRRIGETHHNARISDAIVDAIRERHEDYGIGPAQLAIEFGIALKTITKICYYERRAHTAVRFKRMKQMQKAMKNLNG